MWERWKDKRGNLAYFLIGIQCHDCALKYRSSFELLNCIARCALGRISSHNGALLEEPPLGSLTGGAVGSGGSSKSTNNIGANPKTCPVPTFLSIWAMQESGLPIDLNPEMRQICLPFLERILGAEKYDTYR